MMLLVLCLLAQACLARAMASPWWVPDLTVIGLLLAVTRAPHRWLPLSLVAGAATILWTDRFASAILLGSVGFGWVLQALATRWDMNEWRAQSALAALVSLLMALGALWLDNTWSLVLAGLLVARMLLTALAVPVARRVLRFMP